jgi:RNA polymerase sigma factor (sigma-70 family)
MIEGAPRTPAGTAIPLLTPSIFLTPYVLTDVSVRTLMAPRTDDALLDNARHGDHAARGELLERHRQEMFRVACKTIGHPHEEDAHDLVQDAFIKASTKLDSFKGDAKFSTWLYRITYTTCIDWLRKHAPQQNQIEIDNPEVPDAKWMPILVEDIVTRETRQHQLGALYKRALNHLSDDEKTVLLLQTYHELTTSEIAQRVKKPLGTVKTHLRSAKINMRKHLLHYGLTAEA